MEHSDDMKKPIETIGQNLDTSKLGRIKGFMRICNNTTKAVLLEPVPANIALSIGNILKDFHKDILSLYDPQTQQLDAQKVNSYTEGTAAMIAKTLGYKQSADEKQKENILLDAFMLVAIQLTEALQAPVSQQGKEAPGRAK